MGIHKVLYDVVLSVSTLLYSLYTSGIVFGVRMSHIDPVNKGYAKILLIPNEIRRTHEVIRLLFFHHASQRVLTTIR